MSIYKRILDKEDDLIFRNVELVGRYEREIHEYQKEIASLRCKINSFKMWYDTDGSVGGLSNIMEMMDEQS